MRRQNHLGPRVGKLHRPELSAEHVKNHAAAVRIPVDVAIEEDLLDRGA